jgi:hypothetical protein
MKLTKREIKLQTKFSRAIGIDPKLVLKVYSRGDTIQKKKDRVAAETTLLLIEAKKSGLIKTNKAGKLYYKYQKVYDKMIQDYLTANKEWVPKSFYEAPAKVVKGVAENTAPKGNGNTQDK